MRPSIHVGREEKERKAGSQTTQVFKKKKKEREIPALNAIATSQRLLFIFFFEEAKQLAEKYTSFENVKRIYLSCLVHKVLQ